MEYQYSDIEAHIRRAQEMRSKAMGDILAAGWNKCALWFKSLAQRQFHRNVVAARSTASAIY